MSILELNYINIKCLFHKIGDIGIKFHKYKILIFIYGKYILKILRYWS